MPRRRRRSSRYLALFLTLAALAAAGITFKQLRFSNNAPAPLLVPEVSKPPLATDPARQPLVESSPILSKTPSAPTKKTAATPANSTPSTPIKTIASLTPTPTSTSTPATATLSTSPATQPSGLFADAKALADAGQLVQARDLINASLATLSESNQVSAKKLLNEWNKEIIFGKKVYAADTNQVAYTVPSGAVLQKIAQSNNITWELLAKVNGISDPSKLRAGQTIKLLKGPFNAVVDKKRFTLEIYRGVPGETGAMFLTQFPVGLGKDDSTPPGSWQVKDKLKNPTYYSPRGEGVIPSGDPRNPLGEYWVGLDGMSGAAVGKTSYGIHGTIEPDSIGKSQSMGCIRLISDDIAMVYSLLVEGKSTVVIKD